MANRILALSLDLSLHVIAVTGCSEEKSQRQADDGLSRKIVSERAICQINFRSWLPSTFTVSPDNKRVAFVDIVEGKAAAVVDGKAGKQYDGISLDSFTFSPDSKRLAYAAKVGKKWFIVADGKEGPKYDEVGPYFLGPRREGLVIFSADSKHLAYLARVGNKRFVVTDGKEGERYGGIAQGSLTFSPDGKRLAFAAQVSKKWVVVADGRRQKEYDAVYALTFSPDSKHLAYVAEATKKWFVVVNGREGSEYEGIGEGFRMSAGLENLFKKRRELEADLVKISKKMKEFGAQEGRPKTVDVAESEEIARLQELTRQQATASIERVEAQAVLHNYRSLPESKKTKKQTAFLEQQVQHAGRMVADLENRIIDARKRAKNLINEIEKYNIIHNEYETKADLLNMIIRGIEEAKVELARGRIVFDSPDTLHYLARKGNRIFLVEEKIK
ncbi:MAG: hypothetical protein QGD94_10575 [Planctomycetia bacterium]|nr:hypothetical protein [Planctomycetia bacterium]